MDLLNDPKWIPRPELFHNKNQASFMATQLHVVVLGDHEADAQLMIQELRCVGYDPNWQRVETQTEYLAHLGAGLDLILVNPALVQFDPLSALKILKKENLDIPFIVVTGEIEETAIEYVKQGAYDCLHKDRLTQLGPSVRNALKEKRLRLEKEKTTQEEIRLQTSRADGLLELLNDVAYALIDIDDPRSQMEYLIKIAMGTLGADRAELYRFDPYNNSISFDHGLGYTSELENRFRETSFFLDDERWLIGSVISTRSPIKILEGISNPHNITLDPQVRSGLWVSVRWKNKLLGILSLLSTCKYGFTPQDEHMLKIFTNYAAVAMEKTQLLNESRQRLERIQALREIDLAITGNLDMRLTLKIIIDRVVKGLNIDAAVVLRLNPDNNMLDYGYGKGFHTNALKFTNLGLGEGHAGTAALEKRIVHISNLMSQDTSLLRSPLLKLEGFFSYWAVPLISKERVNGVLEIFHRKIVNPDKEWWDFLKTLATQAAIALDHARLFQDLERSNTELSTAYDSAIEGWSRALDLHDQETEGHTQRVAEITLRLAKAFGMSEDELMHIRRGALLHDIGKVGIPERILNKPASLSEDEWKIMRRHPTFAYEMLSPIVYLRPALDIPYCHHEKWDGSGYPRGLQGDNIPFAARLFSVVDVWDALCSDRPYRKAWEQNDALAYIRENSGVYFDPHVVDAFFNSSPFTKH